VSRLGVFERGQAASGGSGARIRDRRHRQPQQRRIH
jgi:hypothetical protein